ncbi:MAG TPA: C4-type zinc ribbon domain-containing protein [Anaerolineales bacterium]|nr:C4-type zinc ribbon domain-containing protein [Anaerolineales bacterium]
MSASLGLFRLQQVDRQIDQAQARATEIRQLLENDEELRDAKNQLELARAGQSQSERTLREIEVQVKGQQIKIEQSESSLYGGNVHNPKELQDLQNEIAALKRHQSTLEERQLEAMLKADSTQSALQATEANLSRVQSRLGDAHHQLIEEQTELNKNLERLQLERQAIVTDLAHKNLEVYESLRQQRRGVAVAEIMDNACSACGTTLTAALQQSAHSSTQMARCPSCGRILYAR